ncbi:MAG: hypothetical protein K0U57_04270 [Alphaproteobacteria bacterium]|nr:hypothetical protein [Alphaproteobacteria bacterium]MDA9223846.1 hypothetical protein [Tateyamaria sp.]
MKTETIHSNLTRRMATLRSFVHPMVWHSTGTNHIGDGPVDRLLIPVEGSEWHT